MKDIVNILDKHIIKNEDGKEKGTCALCNCEVSNGYLIKNTVSANFNDFYIFKNNSKTLCLTCSSLFKTKNLKENQTLRQVNFFATEKEFITTKNRSVLFDLIKKEKSPFMVGVNFSYKKHFFFFCKVNYNKDSITIGTDKGLVKINLDDMLEIHETAKEMIAFKFSKTEIISGKSIKFNVIGKFGLSKYNDNKMFFSKFSELQLLVVLSFIRLNNHKDKQ